jgi:hypothetical protein
MKFYVLLQIFQLKPCRYFMVVINYKIIDKSDASEIRFTKNRPLTPDSVEKGKGDRPKHSQYIVYHRPNTYALENLLQAWFPYGRKDALLRPKFHRCLLT